MVHTIHTYTNTYILCMIFVHSQKNPCRENSSLELPRISVSMTLCEQGKQPKSHCFPQSTLSDLERDWYKLFGRLEDLQSRVDSVSRQWQDGEDDIQDILVWLKDIRQFLQSPLPGTYDALQTDMAKCRVSRPRQSVI